MTNNCDCCRGRWEMDAKYDPFCSDAFQSGGSTLNARFELSTDLDLSAVSGLGLVEGGSGYFRYRRLPHATMETSGLRITTSFDIRGSNPLYPVVQPIDGKQRLFGLGWVIELDWADETLRAYTSTDEGLPDGAAWYEQEVADFFTARNWWNTGTIKLWVSIEQKKVGSIYRKCLLIRGIPVATKESSSNGLPFYYGVSAEYGTTDMGFDFSSFCGLICSSAMTPHWCAQLPLLLDVDTTDLSYFAYGPKDPHFPDACLLIPTGSIGSSVLAGWEYTRQPLIDGGQTYSPLITFQRASVSGPIWGLSGFISEPRATDETLVAHHYFAEGVDQPNPLPEDWDCDESTNKSVAIYTTCTGAGSTECFTTMPGSFDLTPHGLITPATPP